MPGFDIIQAAAGAGQRALQAGGQVVGGLQQAGGAIVGAGQAAYGGISQLATMVQSAILGGQIKQAAPQQVAPQTPTSTEEQIGAQYAAQHAGDPMNTVRSILGGALEFKMFEQLPDIKTGTISRKQYLENLAAEQAYEKQPTKILTSPLAIFGYEAVATYGVSSMLSDLFGLSMKALGPAEEGGRGGKAIAEAVPLIGGRTVPQVALAAGGAGLTAYGGYQSAQTVIAKGATPAAADEAVKQIFFWTMGARGAMHTEMFPLVSEFKIRSLRPEIIPIAEEPSVMEPLRAGEIIQHPVGEIPERYVRPRAPGYVTETGRTVTHVTPAPWRGMLEMVLGRPTTLREVYVSTGEEPQIYFAKEPSVKAWSFFGESERVEMPYKSGPRAISWEAQLERPVSPGEAGTTKAVTTGPAGYRFEYVKENVGTMKVSLKAKPMSTEMQFLSAPGAKIELTGSPMDRLQALFFGTNVRQAYVSPRTGKLIPVLKVGPEGGEVTPVAEMAKTTSLFAEESSEGLARASPAAPGSTSLLGSRAAPRAPISRGMERGVERGAERTVTRTTVRGAERGAERTITRPVEGTYPTLPSTQKPEVIMPKYYQVRGNVEYYDELKKAWGDIFGEKLTPELKRASAPALAALFGNYGPMAKYLSERST